MTKNLPPLWHIYLPDDVASSDGPFSLQDRLTAAKLAVKSSHAEVKESTNAAFNELCKILDAETLERVLGQLSPTALCARAFVDHLERQMAIYFGFVAELEALSWPKHQA